MTERYPWTDAMTVADGIARGADEPGTWLKVCSDCGTRRPAGEMDYYGPNPLGIEWVCKQPCPEPEPAPRRYTLAQTEPYVRVTRR